MVVATVFTDFLWSYDQRTTRAIDDDKDKVKPPSDLHQLLRETNHNRGTIETSNTYYYFVMYGFSPTPGTVAPSKTREKRYGARVNDLVCINDVYTYYNKTIRYNT